MIDQLISELRPDYKGSKVDNGYRIWSDGYHD